MNHRDIVINNLMPDSIRQIMREAKTIINDVTLFEALKRMIEEKTNSLIVVDNDNIVVGMLNTGDIIKEVVPDYLEGDDAIAAHFANENIFKEAVNDAKNVPIEKFMKKDYVKADINDSLMELAALAISNDQFMIPVVDEKGKAMGLITRTELKQVIGEILGIKCFIHCDK